MKRSVASRTLCAVLFSLGVAGCQPENSPLMSPGEDCLACHRDRGEGRTWTLAGTVFARADAPVGAGVEGAEVLVTDAAGRSLTLRSNSAGNFYTAEALQPPFTVQVQKDNRRMAMWAGDSSGACNRCHAIPPLEGAPGRVFVP